MEDVVKSFDIRVMDNLKQAREFEPQEDMTAREAALVAQGFTVAGQAQLMGVVKDLWGWIQHHNLERHFPPAVSLELPN